MSPNLITPNVIRVVAFGTVRAVAMENGGVFHFEFKRARHIRYRGVNKTKITRRTTEIDNTIQKLVDATSSRVPSR